MKLRLLTLAASVGVVATMIPGHAASSAATPTPKAQITDVSGDANGINDQGLGAPVSANFSGPADDANADITSAVFATKPKSAAIAGLISAPCPARSSR